METCITECVVKRGPEIAWNDLRDFPVDVEVLEKCRNFFIKREFNSRDYGIAWTSYSVATAIFDWVGYRYECVQEALSDGFDCEDMLEKISCFLKLMTDWEFTGKGLSSKKYEGWKLWVVGDHDT